MRVRGKVFKWLDDFFPFYLQKKKLKSKTIFIYLKLKIICNFLYIINIMKMNLIFR